MTGGGIINRQAAVGIRAGGDHKRIHGKTGRQDDAGQSGAAEDKGQSGPVDSRQQNGQNAARKRHHRSDDRPPAG